jgi:hypothetical protein
MQEKIELLIHFIVTLIKLLKPGGVKIVMAETMATKQQLIVMSRGKKRASCTQIKSRRNLVEKDPIKR